jgi:hypothetical protein
MLGPDERRGQEWRHELVSKVPEVNRSAPLAIEDAMPANVALDINELCGIVDNSSALWRDHKGEQ